MDTINEKIKKARIKAGLTQKAMSEKLGIPLNTIERWDMGIRTPPEWVANLIIYALTKKKKSNLLEDK